MTAHIQGKVEVIFRIITRFFFIHQNKSYTLRLIYRPLHTDKGVMLLPPIKCGEDVLTSSCHKQMYTEL